MTAEKLKEMIVSALEVEGEKQECVVEVYARKNSIFVKDERSKIWTITITKGD